MNNTMIQLDLSDICNTLYSTSYSFQILKEYYISPWGIINYFKLNDNENNVSEFIGCNENIKRKSISLNAYSRKGLK